MSPRASLAVVGRALSCHRGGSHRCGCRRPVLCPVPLPLSFASSSPLNLGPPSSLRGVARFRRRRPVIHHCGRALGVLLLRPSVIT